MHLNIFDYWSPFRYSYNYVRRFTNTNPRHTNEHVEIRAVNVFFFTYRKVWAYVTF